MGDNQTAYTELRARYNAAWTPPPTEFPNETPPNKDALWARFTITDGKEKQLDIGSPVHSFRTFSALTVQLFAPPLSGAITVLAKADLLAGYFRNWSGATVQCYEASVKKIGNDPLGYYQVNVSVLFRVDALH